MCIGTSSASNWLFVVVLLSIFVIGGLLAILIDPGCAGAFRRWRQRQARRRLKKKLPGKNFQDKKCLCAAWDSNPAAVCAQFFRRFTNPPKKVEREQLMAELESAIEKGLQLCTLDYVAHFTDIYRKLLVVRTGEIAKSLAALHPDNAAFVIHQIAQDDAQTFRVFDETIREALEEGRTEWASVGPRLEQLRQNFARFHKIICPGFLSSIGNIIIGALTGAALGYVGIDSSFVIRNAARFTAGKWAGWNTQRDEEFGDQFVEALHEVPVACERINAAVRSSLTTALDSYLRHRLRH